MTNNLSVILKKYSVPTLFFIAGIAMLLIGITQNQGLSFNLASIMMFIAGGLSIMFSNGSFKPSLIYIFGAAAGVAGLVALFMSYNSVEETNTYNKNYGSLCAVFHFIVCFHLFVLINYIFSNNHEVDDTLILTFLLFSFD